MTNLAKTCNQKIFQPDLSIISESCGLYFTFAIILIRNADMCDV